MSDPASELSQIAGEIRRCKKCPLWKTRINAVPGDGPVSAEAIIVGEAPGRTEDLHGQPFVGSAGRNLDVFLREAGLDRKRAFITNTVKCRPPSNRRPNKKELETCYQYLRRQIELISPKIVVLLGDVAVREFFPDSSLSSLHGRLLKRGGISYFPTYHPAAVIYNPSLKQTIIDDFRGLGRELGSRDGAV
jgi:DNA polymerase